MANRCCCALFLVTFVATFFSEALNQLFLGLPLGYVIAAQGSLVVYLVLIGLYAFLMNCLIANSALMHQMTWLSLMVALRGLLELVLWLMVGRGVLQVLAGRYSGDNAVIRMFDFLLRPVRACSAC